MRRGARIGHDGYLGDESKSVKALPKGDKHTASGKEVGGAIEGK